MTYRNKNGKKMFMKINGNDLKVLRYIIDNTLRDKIRNEDIRNICEIQNIIRWVKIRKDHISKMTGWQKLGNQRSFGTSFDRFGTKVGYHKRQTYWIKCRI